MDPVTISVTVDRIIAVVGAVKALVDALQVYRQNHQAVKAFVRFLDRMKDVLNEQREERLSHAGCRILKAIQQECSSVESTAHTFLQRNIVVRFATSANTVESLRESRVSLHEHWTLYLVSLSAAGSASAATLQLGLAQLHITTASGQGSGMISAHLSQFSRAVAAIISAGADARCEQQLLDLSRSPPGALSDGQEQQLASAIDSVQAAVHLPPTSGAIMHALVEEMRAAMSQSVAAGLAGLCSQLQALCRQNEEIAQGTQAMLAQVRHDREALDAVAFSGGSAGLQPGSRRMLAQFSAAIEREQQCVFDHSLMACPVTGVRFKGDGHAAPTLVPGCHCVVIRAAAERYRARMRCGLCREVVPAEGEPNSELKNDRVTLNFLDDLASDRLPAIRKFVLERDFREGEERSTRHGTEGVVRFGTLRGEPVAVKTVEFATAGLPQQQWRCRRHVLLNSICTQHRAARASPNVCDVVGLCWGETCAHVAMPRYQMTLEEHVGTLPFGMPLHRVLELCCVLTRAVHEVHASGIIHCDITPSNVLMAEDGTPRLIDFGLSHISRDGMRTRTSVGFTPHYAPIEQEIGGRVNEASDIHALGRTLVYAATGSRPSRRGQDLPEGPPELRQQLELMTQAEEAARKEVELPQVIAVFGELLLQHGPTPVAQVHTAEALASQLTFGDTVDMGGREIALADGRPSEQAATHIVSDVQILNEHLHVMTWALQDAPASPRWELYQGGATLRAVTLALPQRGQLHVLNGAAVGTWQNVTLKGGGHSTIVIAGKMVLDNVKFDGCTLVATETADLTVSSCTFSNCQVAAFATGAGAKAAFKCCEIDMCENGIVVSSGTSVTVDAKCKIACCGNGCCVTAHGAGAFAAVTGATLRYTTDESPSALWRACVAVLRGGMVNLGRGATVTGEGRAGGVLSLGHRSKADLKECSVAAAGCARSVWAAHSGTADLRHCTIRGGMCGLFSTESGRVNAGDCTVADCSEHCADVRLRGGLFLSDCSLSGSKEHCGLSVNGEGSMAKVTGGTISGNAGCGVIVSGEGAHVTARGATATGNTWHGVHACFGAHATLHSCSLLSSKHGSGVLVSGRGSRVEAEDCHFSQNAVHGARAHIGALTATACTASSNGSREEYAGLSQRLMGSRGCASLPVLTAERSGASTGSGHLQWSGGHRRYHGQDPGACGFYAHSPDSNLTLKNCEAVANCSGGFVAAHGAHIDAAHCTAADNGGPGAAVWSKANGKFAKSVFRGTKAAPGVDVFGEGTSAELQQCTAMDNAESGVCLRGGATLKDTRSVSESNASSGWYLEGSGTDATVEGMVSRWNCGCGVVVQQSAVLKACMSIIDGNLSTGVHVLARGDARLRQSSVLWSKEGSGVVAADHKTRATLTTCMVASNHRYGVLVCDSAELTVWGPEVTGLSVFEKNRLSNACVRTRGEAWFQDCHMAESVERSGLNVEGKETRANVTNCTLARNALCGIIAQKQAWLEGAQVTVSGNMQAGVCVHTAATAQLRRLRAENCAHGSGLLVDGQGSEVLIEHSDAQGNDAAGMEAQKGGSVIAKHVTMWGNSRAGAVVDKQSLIALQACVSTDPTPYIAPRAGGHMRRSGCNPA